MCCAKQPMQSNMLIQLALLLLFHGACNIPCSSAASNYSRDMLSLLDFKRALNDPGQRLGNWNASTPYCQWRGVTCSRAHTDRVVVLNLASQGLTGTLTDSLGNLTFLRTLNLSTNHFSGQLPDLSHLRKLEILDLSHNSLQGVVPDTLTSCSNLRELVLHYNILEGEIPLKIGLLSKLSILRLGYNNLTGAIPPTLSKTQLTMFKLPNNYLTGSIPPEFAHLSNLSILNLGGNMLSGAFPAVLLNMPSLQVLDLGGNRLHGMLPSDLGDALPNLVQFGLFSNSFQGPIPASLGNAVHLELMDLSVNNFSGEIPSSFGSLTQLDWLNLETNQLEATNTQSWEFLYALRTCKNLRILSLDGNRLSGAIPDYIGELSIKLQFLKFGGNNLSGIVPSSIGNLTGLLELELSENNLTGTIGEWIGRQINLTKLRLDNNNFNGPIPASIGNLKQLSQLSLAQNDFTGTIPASLGDLDQLSILNLSHNNLYGNLPLGIFSIPTLTKCVLSYNKLQGPIPPEVGYLIHLNELRLSSNKIVGEIPVTLSECLDLYVMELDQNVLTGSIPMSFINLISLSTLNLSHNSLSGSIPRTISALKNLIHLDLSYNHLQGEIPLVGVFANATIVSLNSNLGLCGGVEDFHMHACPIVSRKIKWKYYLTILLISVFGFMSLAMSVYAIFVRKKASRWPYLLMFSFGKKFPRLSYKNLAQATENFAEFNLIGSGSYGSVYRGKLIQAKIEVAIKVFDLEKGFANKSFTSECEILRTIRHRNLVPVFTACSTIDNRGNDFKALVYEFMHNGNLDTWLHQKNGGIAPKILSLAQRIQIAVDVADALVYLHYECGRPIVHCDLKPTNILLDEQMNAYLGDFGIASLLSDSRSTSVGHSDSHSSVAVLGTIGYIAPEYAQNVHTSTCGDVYSFGVVLLEMLIGKRPTDSMFDGELSIVSFVEMNRDQILQIIDANLQEECLGFIQAAAETQNVILRCLFSLMQVAFSCTSQLPRERLNMREVAINLHTIKRSYAAAT